MGRDIGGKGKGYGVGWNRGTGWEGEGIGGGKDGGMGWEGNGVARDEGTGTMSGGGEGRW